MTNETLYFYREINAQRIEYIVVRIDTYYDSNVVKIRNADIANDPGYLVMKDTLVPLTESQLERYTMLKLAGEDTAACYEA